MNIIRNKPCVPCTEKYETLRRELRDMDIPLVQDHKEFADLCREVGTLKPKVFVEIGSKDGGSLWMLSHYCAPGATIVSIDIPGSLWGRKDSDINKMRVLQDLTSRGYKTHSIEQDSQLEETKSMLCEHLADKPIDFLFIDGDHRFGGVLRDWKLYHPLVQENGMVAFHDITERPQQRRIKVFFLWRSLATIFNHKEFITNQTKSPGIGVLYK